MGRKSLVGAELPTVGNSGCPTVGLRFFHPELVSTGAGGVPPCSGAGWRNAAPYLEYCMSHRLRWRISYVSGILPQSADRGGVSTQPCPALDAMTWIRASCVLSRRSSRI